MTVPPSPAHTLQCHARRAHSTANADIGPGADVVAALNHEWRSLCDDPAPWSPAGLTLGEVLDAIPDDPDRQLLALVLRCQGGCTLAGRIVVQALLGRLVLMAGRDTRVSCDDLVAAVWVRMATYPVARRRRAVASNLTLDARKDVLRERRILRPVPDPQPRDDLSATAMLRAAMSLRLVTDETADVLASVYADGLTSRDAGVRHGLSAQAVRWRCSHGVRMMRERRAELLELCS